jgi:hypothetical protein
MRSTQCIYYHEIHALNQPSMSTFVKNGKDWLSDLNFLCQGNEENPVLDICICQSSVVMLALLVDRRG